MHLVKVKIEKDSHTISYIKKIRDFDSSLSIGEIKKHIDQNEAVLTFDLDGTDWLHMENMTENKWHRYFLKFLKELQKMGAQMELSEEYIVFEQLHKEKISMRKLEQKIRFNKEIWDEVENNPD